MPDDVPTVATPVLLLVHVPPGTPLPSVDVPPVHTVLGPVIDVGEVLTVSVVVE